MIPSIGTYLALPPAYVDGTSVGAAAPPAYVVEPTVGVAESPEYAVEAVRATTRVAIAGVRDWSRARA